MTKSENNKRVCLCVCVYLCLTYIRVYVCMYLSIWLWLMVISSHLIYCKMLNFTKRKCLLERKLLFLVLAAFLFFFFLSYALTLLLLLACLSFHSTRFISLLLSLSLPRPLLSRRHLFVLPTISLLILNSFSQPNSLANAVGFVGTVSVSIAGKTSPPPNPLSTHCHTPLAL